MRNVLKKILIFLCIATLVAGCIVPDAGTALAADASYSGIANKNERGVLKLVNKERTNAGLEPVSTFQKLQSACNIRVKELAQLFDHQRPDGSICFTALDKKKIGYMAAGENIAAGQPSPADVMESWMNSPGHRQNILSGNFQHMGVGYSAGGSYGTEWVQLFIGGCSPSSIRVNNASKVTAYKKGSSIDSMNRYLAVKCVHGTSYAPITSRMCKGYRKNTKGKQTITVSYQGLTAKFTVKIK